MYSNIYKNLARVNARAVLTDLPTLILPTVPLNWLDPRQGQGGTLLLFRLLFFRLYPWIDSPRKNDKAGVYFFCLKHNGKYQQTEKMYMKVIVIITWQCFCNQWHHLHLLSACTNQKKITREDCAQTIPRTQINKICELWSSLWRHNTNNKTSQNYHQNLLDLCAGVRTIRDSLSSVLTSAHLPPAPLTTSSKLCFSSLPWSLERFADKIMYPNTTKQKWHKTCT